MSGLRSALRDNSLSLFFALLFAVTIAAQTFAGQRASSAEQRDHGRSGVSWLEYVTSFEFWGAVMENWQSEFLQFTVFVGATIWLVQRGSAESKPVAERGRGPAHSSPATSLARFRMRLYENSLLLAMGAIFFLTWLAQSLNNWRLLNEERAAHSEKSMSWGRYLVDPDFWEKTLQNWQSEFLAVGVMVVFTIYLRQRGSPESKPVSSSDDETGAG